jgi:hypothetical protein
MIGTNGKLAKWFLLVVVLVAAAVILPGSVSAAPLPIVTVSSGPTTPTTIVRECDDVAQVVEVADAFVVHRDTADASPLVVTYTTSGTAESGSDFEPLSGSVTIPANADSATVPIRVLLGERTEWVSLDVTISGGAEYTLGAPVTVRLELKVRRDPALGPVDCNPRFQLGPDATNREQTIRVGETPVGITTTGDSVHMRLVDGELPPGVAIFNANGKAEFLGTASDPGDYSATLAVCPQAIVFTCRQTTLVIHVLPASDPILDRSVVIAPRLPATGTPALTVAVLGLALLLTGAITAVASRDGSGRHTR